MLPSAAGEGLRGPGLRGGLYPRPGSEDLQRGHTGRGNILQEMRKKNFEKFITKLANSAFFSNFFFLKHFSVPDYLLVRRILTSASRSWTASRPGTQSE